MKITNLDKNWIFSYSSGNAYQDAHGAAYKDVVDLPHDFMIRTKRTPDSRTEGAGGYFQGGIGTYTNYFMLDEELAGEQVMLRIEGSYGNTEVWINGNLATLHHYGYTEFLVDLTEYVKYGTENKLKIVVENNLLPNSRWYSGSGLYRHVSLLEAGDVYLNPWSVFVTTPSLNQIDAEVTVTCASKGKRKVNPAGMVKDAAADAITERDRMDDKAEITLTIMDEDGAFVRQMSQMVTLDSCKNKVKFTCVDENLKVWNLENPHLYRALVTVESGDVKDTHEVSFGVRTIAFTREEGFLLNDEPVKLKGGCIHHDNGIVGSCAFTAMEERKIRLLKESGYNAIRTSHNPMSTALLDVCDKYGMLVMDELYDCWRAKKNPGDYHLYFEKYWKEDTESVVLRDRNHPSVIMYSIGNEIGERDCSGHGAQISHDLSECVRALDKTRAITNGVCMIFLDAGEFGGILANIFGSGDPIDFSTLPPEILNLLAQGDYMREHWGEITAPFMEDLDVAGYNYLDDRYTVDGETFPNRLIVGTESYPKMMKTVWERTMAHPYVLGDFTWTAFDYLGESGIGHALYDEAGGLFCEYPWHVGNCGDYDITGYIMPQGQYRKLLWGTQDGPVITVLKPEHFGKKEAISTWGWADVRESYSWPGAEGKQVRVDVYSKAEEVEILVNGKSQGRAKVDYMWTAQMNITYEPGVLEAVEYTNGVAGGRATLATCGAPAQLTCELENWDAKDVSIYKIIMKDADGNRVPWYSGKVKVILPEGARLVGLGTGDPVTEEDFFNDTCTLYEGRALLVVENCEEEPLVNVWE